jgi:isopentenyldiphosphate isomerase
VVGAAGFKIDCMQSLGPSLFLAALSPAQHGHLAALHTSAMQAAPEGWLRWRCGVQALGLLSPQRAEWLLQQLADCELLPEGPQFTPELVWHADRWSEPERSECLQNALLQARDAGLLTGWRNERFSFWHSDCTAPDPAQPPLLRVERAGFRFLGMLSHAVHVNGFMPDGRLWCARRALSKATDPGLLDNVTAGGLPSGETVQMCLQRELAEEAGLFQVQGHHLQAAGSVRTARHEPQGWHDEIVHVFNLDVQPDFVPMNQDGEVAEFMCLAAPEVLSRIQAGAFTVDAVQTLVVGLRAGAGLSRLG